MNELKIGVSPSSSLERVFICGKFLFWSSVSFLPDSQPPLPQPDRSDVLPYRLKCGFPPHLRVDFFLLFVFLVLVSFRFLGLVDSTVKWRGILFIYVALIFLVVWQLLFGFACYFWRSSVPNLSSLHHLCFGRIRGASSPLLFWILKHDF